MGPVVKRGWRTAATAFGLLFLAGGVVLVGVLTVRGAQADAARVAQFLGIVFAVPALAIRLVAWWRQETVAMAPAAGQLDEARETLARVVAQQWRQETLARSLGNPQPMPVCWGLTEPTMMDHPQLIAVGELSFTGRSDQIGSLAAEFRRLRRRRLVILGGPGSGKTTLAVQLLLELLATRQPGEPIPVLVTLAGWDPTDEPQLHTWLASRLAEDYPSLRAFGPTTADTLAKQGHLLPILDGLDELPESRQPEVIAALNKSLTDTDQLVLTSRTTEYTTAITEARDVLTSAAVIAPEPLTTTQAADYLTHCLPPYPDPSWRELLHRLRTGTAEHLATMLATPLGLWLLRTVYITPRADPTSLLTPDTTPVQGDLFDQLIPAVLTTRPASRHHSDAFRPRHTWDPHDVRHWLTYLAHQLHHTDTRNLYW
jgi:NACHT domain